ncbi:chitinase-3-like protein 2 [Bactrocera neohumeralis]|uniref:chitinase-3-like protein 2 n=1 Tax=Bactrocera tryoni TaxID=59916 RepID=UPI001A9973A9|nr:chitinase-3-like protein 2 [Bactrocera tryoni]XP_050327851.1 chitinase-3-like protein 2 [Bactrocera neohumeralis]
MADYELMDEPSQSQSWWRIAALMALYMLTTILVFLLWSSAYDNIYYPPDVQAVPDFWYRRANLYANSVHESTLSHDFRLVKNQSVRVKLQNPAYAADSGLNGLSQQQKVKPSAPQLVKNAPPTMSTAPEVRLVCYYSVPDPENEFDDLRLANVNAELCTHINVGMVSVSASNGQLIITENLHRILKEDVLVLRTINPALKLLLWIGGGANSDGFPAMVKNHTTRKMFLHSVKQTLAIYKLDGIDLDWEFPSAYNKERQHFSQLIYEIRQEYRREHRDYLLTVAAAAPEGIAVFAYDVQMLNQYVDYVSLMTYDYHFYSHGTPFTGLNAPLYARPNERSLLGTLNINYSVNWWLTNGLDRKKLVVGLPTYGHSFTLVSSLNNGVGAPAEDIGHCGSMGFTSYSELCWFNTHNLVVHETYDQSTCSPYLSSGTEWISYENETSIACKALYVKAHQLGGAMIFSLNTDDVKGYCPRAYKTKFPLVETVKSILFSKS